MVVLAKSPLNAGLSRDSLKYAGHLRATGMMGRQQNDQAKLFYEFCLEDRVPSNHLLRKIDRFVDLSELRAIIWLTKQNNLLW
jgi:hypothetical protein